MPVIERESHTDDLKDEQKRLQRWFWYYLCLYVEDEWEKDGKMCDAIHAHLNIINTELNKRGAVRPRKTPR